MQIIESQAKEYAEYMTHPAHIFNSAEFALLNQNKYERLHFLLFKEKKVRAGIILAEKQQKLYSPVSAPFGGFTYSGEEPGVETTEALIQALAEFAQARNMPVQITLPPLFYDNNFLVKCHQAFSRSKFSLAYSDLNYQLETGVLGREYAQNIPPTGRNKLSGGMKNEFLFFKARNTEEICRAYKVIQQNRQSKGYPLRMTLEQVLDTIKIIPADFFLLQNDNIDIAAAQIFHVAEHIVQVIYWGDIPAVSQLKAMNVLALKIYEYYLERGIKIVDIGPACEDGVPNYGLCNYKTSIGCCVSLKNTYYLVSK